jgi:hypothetical protein
MDLACWYFQGDSFEDFGAVFEGCVEVVDLEAHVGKL